MEIGSPNSRYNYEGLEQNFNFTRLCAIIFLNIHTNSNYIARVRICSGLGGSIDKNFTGGGTGK